VKLATLPGRSLAERRKVERGSEGKSIFTSLNFTGKQYGTRQMKKAKT
jgi:hypothetical protein